MFPRNISLQLLFLHSVDFCASFYLVSKMLDSVYRTFSAKLSIRPVNSRPNAISDWKKSLEKITVNCEYNLEWTCSRTSPRHVM